MLWLVCVLLILLNLIQVLIFKTVHKYAVFNTVATGFVKHIVVNYQTSTIDPSFFSLKCAILLIFLRINMTFLVLIWSNQEFFVSSYGLWKCHWIGFSSKVELTKALHTFFFTLNGFLKQLACIVFIRIFKLIIALIIFLISFLRSLVTFPGIRGWIF